jgi:hypothetical protein
VDRRDELITTRTIRRRMFFALSGWAAFSWAIGLSLLLADASIASGWPRSLARAAAAQCVIWGILNTAFAMAGLRQAQRADRTPVSSTAIDRELHDRDRLVRVLQFSRRVSLAFIALGVLILTLGGFLRLPTAIGHGAAMLVQTAFLAIYDGALGNQLTSTRAGASANQPDNAGPAIDALRSGR